MIQKRIGVFETNSSSTHTLCIVTKEEFERMTSGEFYVEQYGDKVYTPEEAMEEALKWHNYGRTNGRVTVDDLKAMSQEDLDDFLHEHEIVKFENWGSDELEYFEESYTTPSGDEIVVFGQYGHD